MLKSAYGGNQVDIAPLGVDTGVPSPAALVEWGIMAAAMNGKGSCYGLLLASQQMSQNTNLINSTNGLPAGKAATAYNLIPNGPLVAMIENDQVAQWDPPVLRIVTGWQAANVGGQLTTGSVYNQIAGELAKGEHPIIGLPKASHAVLAYGLEPGPKGNGDYYIDTSDPDSPYNYKGDETSQASHLMTETGSRIYVSPTSNGTWSFSTAGDTPYTGGMGSLIVMNQEVTTQAPQFMSSPGGLLNFVFGSSPTAVTGPSASPKMLGVQSAKSIDVETLMALSGSQSGIAWKNTSSPVAATTVISHGTMSVATSFEQTMEMLQAPPMRHKVLDSVFAEAVDGPLSWRDVPSML